MTEPFKNVNLSVDAPAIGALAVTPSDSVDLARPIRALTIGSSGGTLRYVSREGVICSTGPLPVGTYPFFALRILATGTTATGLTGWV